MGDNIHHIRNPRAPHAPLPTNPSHDPSAAPTGITTLVPTDRRPRPTAAENQNNYLVNHIFYRVMVGVTLVSWLLPEIQKLKIITSEWIPLGFDISWLVSALALAICNLSKGRRFHFRHITAITLTTFFHALAASEPSFLLMQTAVDLGIFFGDYTEEYYPDTPPANNHFDLPAPVQTPTRPRPAHRRSRAGVGEDQL